MSHESWGKLFIGIGLIFLILGVIVYFFGSFLGSKFGGLGRLPGDLVYESENVKFYAPLTTLILLNLLIWVGVRIYSWISKK